MLSVDQPGSGTNTPRDRGRSAPCPRVRFEGVEGRGRGDWVLAVVCVRERAAVHEGDEPGDPAGGQRPAGAAARGGQLRRRVPVVRVGGARDACREAAAARAEQQLGVVEAGRGGV
eukprot:2127470-Rhodomonas_salina.1